MAFLTNEKSIHEGHPVELFAFEGPSSALSYYYTNHEQNVDYGGNTYLSRPLMRSTLGVAAASETGELMINGMSVSLPLIQEYVFKTPPRSLGLTVYRYHLGDEANVETYWKGVITGFKVSDRIASARATTKMESALNSELPNVYYQNLCNHRLFDDRCAASTTGHIVSDSVEAIAGKVITVYSDGGKADGYFNGGYIVRDTDGEKRLIVDHTGDDLTLAYAFRDLEVDDAVTMRAGCDHTVETCRDKFSDNVANFGGHPFIATGNPFKSGTEGV
jgi:uncharacterized phage protein (TIGR02218 family)